MTWGERVQRRIGAPAQTTLAAVAWLCATLSPMQLKAESHALPNPSWNERLRQLDRDVLRTEMRDVIILAQRCRTRVPELEQTLELEATIVVAPSGRVKKATLRGDAPAALRSCVLATIRGFRFSRAVATMKTKQRFIFAARSPR